jgi:hypothetical protein
MNSIKIGGINIMTFKVNNNQTIDLTQDKNDGSITATKTDFLCDDISRYNISAGDMVMLLNYYQYIKNNNMQCDFINPYGVNTK